MTSKYIYENCNFCGVPFDNIGDIYVDIDTDKYICFYCSEEKNIEVKPCIDDLDDDEERFDE